MLGCWPTWLLGWPLQPQVMLGWEEAVSTQSWGPRDSPMLRAYPCSRSGWHCAETVTRPWAQGGGGCGPCFPAVSLGSVCTCEEGSCMPPRSSLALPSPRHSWNKHQAQWIQPDLLYSARKLIDASPIIIPSRNRSEGGLLSISLEGLFIYLLKRQHGTGKEFWAFREPRSSHSDFTVPSLVTLKSHLSSSMKPGNVAWLVLFVRFHWEHECECGLKHKALLMSWCMFFLPINCWDHRNLRNQSDFWWHSGW